MLQPGKQYESKANQELAKAMPSGSKSSAIPVPTTMSSSSGAQSSPSSSSSSSQSTKEDRANLSRRQRKNRTKNPREQRCEPHAEEPQQSRQYVRRRNPESNMWNFKLQTQASCYQFRSDLYEKNKDPNGIGTGENKSDGFLSTVRRQLLMSNAELEFILRSFTLPWDQLPRFGYPIEYSNSPGKVGIINYFPLKSRTHHHRTHLDANAQEFVPGGNVVTPIESEVDSGNSSGSSDLEQESSSDSDKNSDNGESTCSSSSDFACQEASRRNSATELHERVHIVPRKCARCEKVFYVRRDDGSHVCEDQCTYHWGRLRTESANCMQIRVWDCCRGQYDEPGCTTAKMHVWTGLVPGYNGPFEGFVCTQMAKTVPEDGYYGVYALDCEMCFTLHGFALVKVSVVDINGTIVYDTLVKPDAEVIDYNTRFSGITASDLANVSTTLRDVQNDLISFIHAQTILIGHGLENDLRALKLLHTTVIDTCAVYPHYLGFPFRSSLKKLATLVLQEEIQVRAHDSVQDARTVLDLILKKVQYCISCDYKEYSHSW